MIKLTFVPKGIYKSQFYIYFDKKCYGLRDNAFHSAHYTNEHVKEKTILFYE